MKNISQQSGVEVGFSIGNRKGNGKAIFLLGIGSDMNTYRLPNTIVTPTQNAVVMRSVV